jgi:sulfate permease, SulP family
MNISWAFRKSLAGYNLTTLQSDLLAGLIVSLVALPLAMALSIAVGLPPQYGLYTAIVAGVSVPLLGGSFHQVSGPTAAFVVVIAPIVTAHGLRGLIITTLIAGIILILAGLLSVGRFISYIPYPVTTGFTSGIAVVIAVLSINDFLGLHIINMPESFYEKLVIIVQSLPSMHRPDVVVGSVSLMLMFWSYHLINRIPSPVIGLAAGTILCAVFVHFGYEVDTIGTRFHYLLPDGSTGYGIPPYLPSFGFPGLSNSELFAWPSLVEVKMLIVPSLVVAALAALESLLSAAVADSMAETKHNPNAELIGIGIGNILSGLASGIPATGAIARTATNIQNGGKTPVAASFHAILIVFYVLFFAQYLSYVPMSFLAALLLITAYRMSHVKQFYRILKFGPSEDSITLIICFGFTVAIDMIAGVTVGIITACFLLIKRFSGITSLQTSHQENKESKINHESIPKNVAIYHINGSIFFGNVEEILEQIEVLSPHINTFIVDLIDVPFVDITGMIAIKRMVMDLSKNNKKTILCANMVLANMLKRKLMDVSNKDIYFEGSVEKALERTRGLSR